jgi:acyl carrier protein phosphodiesterase
VNYLAHAYLSFGEPKILVGNFIGDFVRGSIDKVYEREIVNGIRLHWEIDRFTDHHPVVKEAQSMLRPEYGRYATVITDMYFDYFLCKYWKNYHHQPVDQFALETYETLDSFMDILPLKFLKVFGNMRYYNFLAGYGDLDNFRRAMTGMAKKAKFNSKMETAHIFLDQNHEYLRVHFGDFFEDLVSHSKKKLIEIREKNDRLPT